MVKAMYSRLDANRIQDFRLPVDPRPLGQVMPVDDCLAFMSACCQAIEEDMPVSTVARIKGGVYRLTLSPYRGSFVGCVAERVR